MLKNINRGLVRLWLVLSFAAAGSVADVAEYAVSQPGAVLTIAGLVCFMVLKATALTILYALCRKNCWLKGAAIVVIAAFISLSLLNGFCSLFYGFGISMKLFKIMAETNPTEVGEFMPELIAKFVDIIHSIWLWVAVIVFAVLWKWLPKVPGKWLL